MSQAKLLDQLLKGGRLLQRVEVLAVKVLNQSALQAGLVISFLHKGRHGLKAGPPRSPPTPFPGDQLVLLVTHRTNQDRLKEPQLPNRGGQTGEGLLVDVPPRLVGIGTYAGDRHVPEGGGSPGTRLDRNEGSQTPTQPAVTRHR